MTSFSEGFWIIKETFGIGTINMPDFTIINDIRTVKL